MMFDSSTYKGPRRRNGNLAKCEQCGKPLQPKRGSRRQTYCNLKCRDAARRERNFIASGYARHPSPAIPRSVENSTVISVVSKGQKRGRAFPLNILGGHRWPGAEPLDRVRKIILAEIGGER
jgi:hypothetical protein